MKSIGIPAIAGGSAGFASAANAGVAKAAKNIAIVTRRANGRARDGYRSIDGFRASERIIVGSKRAAVSHADRSLTCRAPFRGDADCNRGGEDVGLSTTT